MLSEFSQQSVRRNKMQKAFQKNFSFYTIFHQHKKGLSTFRILLPSKSNSSYQILPVPSIKNRHNGGKKIKLFSFLFCKCGTINDALKSYMIVTLFVFKTAAVL
jgi:hypothetical protein